MMDAVCKEMISSFYITGIVFFEPASMLLLSRCSRDNNKEGQIWTWRYPLYRYMARSFQDFEIFHPKHEPLLD